MKISDYPVKNFNKEDIDNCFFIDKNNNNKSVIPLKSIFDEIISIAKKEGLKVELQSDRIVFITNK